MIEIIYSLLFGLTLLSALMVVFARQVIYAALYLVITMISIAGLFIMINAQLAAILQILVYAGAIMVLFLFVIMLLNLHVVTDLPVATRGVRRAGVALFALFAFQVALLAVKFGLDLSIDPAAAESIGIREVALTLLTDYLYAFEATSILLLIAIIGAMVLGRRTLLQRAAPSRDEVA